MNKDRIERFANEVRNNLALDEYRYKQDCDTAIDDLTTSVSYIGELLEALREEQTKSLSGNWRLQQ